MTKSGNENEEITGFSKRCELCYDLEELFAALKGYLNKIIRRNLQRQKEDGKRPIRIAKQYMQTHYMEGISLEEIAGIAGFSPGYFSSLMKKEMGIGFSEYLTQLRMEKAKELLKGTNKNIKDICRQVGYSMEKKWRYLSYRLQLFSLAIFFFWLFDIVSSWIFVIKTGEFIVTAGVTTIMFAAFLCAFVFVVYRPYQRADKNLNLFLMGYTSTGLKDENCMLSPGMEELTKVLIRLTESDQLLKANKRQAQYLALQNQINPHFLYNTLDSIRSEAMLEGHDTVAINPHFLYNTLDSIRSEAMLEGNDTVAEMTEALATFFRYTISKVENMVALEEELENAKVYFQIQKYRFEDRVNLEIEYDVEDEILLRCLLPKLTIQPVVENSIIHGIERKLGNGTIRIALKCTEKRLMIEISDDGVGMQPEVLERLNHQLNQPVFESIQLSKDKGGIAIMNVNNRIHLLFGEEYGMTVYSTPNVGTDTVISLPLITSERQLKRVKE